MSTVWSPIALLIVITMIFIALALLVALIVLGFSGRLRAKLPVDEDAIPPAGLPTSGATFFLPREILLQDTQDEDTAAESSPPPSEEEPPPSKPPRRKTGLRYLLAGLALPLFALWAFSGADTPSGTMQMFTLGTALCLVLQAVQIVCIVLLVRAQRRL